MKQKQEYNAWLTRKEKGGEKVLIDYSLKEDQIDQAGEKRSINGEFRYLVNDVGNDGIAPIIPSEPANQEKGEVDPATVYLALVDETAIVHVTDWSDTEKIRLYGLYVYIALIAVGNFILAMMWHGGTR